MDCGEFMRRKWVEGGGTLPIHKSNDLPMVRSETGYYKVVDGKSVGVTKEELMREFPLVWQY